MVDSFKKPELPFLLISHDLEGNVSYSWMETEEALQETASEFKEYGDEIVYAIEIQKYRDIEIPPNYLVDDFIDEINCAYEKAKNEGFYNIVLAIDTNEQITYYICETENGFQCDKFDYCWDDLDSLSSALFDEAINGKPIEIRIE